MSIAIEIIGKVENRRGIGGKIGGVIKGGVMGAIEGGGTKEM